MIGAGLLTLAFLLAPIQANPNAHGQFDIFEETYNGSHVKGLKKGTNDPTAIWPDGLDGFPRIPYRFYDVGALAINETTVQPGLDHWMEHTCLNFEEINDTSQEHLIFYKGPVCDSYLGRRANFFGQGISIGQDCSHIGMVVQTIGLAIGFWYESMRKDRDDYIRVLWDNVLPGEEWVYDKVLDNNYGVPYDLTSVMHNEIYWYTRNGLPTFITRDPMNQQVPQFTRTELSHRDKLTANRMYNCIGKWLAACNMSSDPCVNDGYTGADCACVCPPNTNGSLCENITGDYYGDRVHPQSEEISYPGGMISVEGPLGTGIISKSIGPPPVCHEVVVLFTYTNMTSSNCSHQNFTVVYDPEDDYGDIERICAVNITTSSELSSSKGIGLIMYNEIDYPEGQVIWQANVTYVEIPGCTTTTPAPSCPVHPIPVCVPCPTTPAPPILSPAVRYCERGGTKRVIRIPKGKAIKIASPRFPDNYPRARLVCGWKLKAAGRGSLDVTCDTFDVNGRDRVRLHREPITYFRDDNVLTSNPNIMAIRFVSWKRSSGPGFNCTVVSE